MQLFQNLMPRHLLFLASTKQQVAQCRYFLLKYLTLYNLKPPANTTLHIYTSDPVAFEGFTNFFASFQMQDAAALINNTITKTGALQFFLQHNSGSVLYCDTTTYPLQPLEPLFADIEKGSLYLHSPQRYAENELTKALRRFTTVRDHTDTAATTPLQASTTSWRASVIGLSEAHKDVLTKLMQDESNLQSSLASDYMYTRAFSEAGKIKSAAKYIFDYSRFAEFDQLLDAFFKKNEEENIPNQVKLLHHIDAAAIQQQKETYEQQPLFKKWLQVITGKRWSIKQYENRW